MTAACTGLRHDALLYGSDEEFLDVIVPFVREGLDGGEAVVAVTTTERIALLRDTLGAEADPAAFIDAVAWYAHPMRTIAGYAQTLDERLAAGFAQVRVVGEVQFGETEEEQRDWVRYEAALNAVFADRPAWIVCPYDERVLPPWISEHAARTHPGIWRGGQRGASDVFADPDDALAGLPAPQPVQGEQLADLELSGDLTAMRRTVRGIAHRAGLPSDSVDELVLALTEAVTNALVHGRPPVRLRISIDGAALTCEVSESGGQFCDPLAGFMPATAQAEGGRGLWLVRTLCDRVEFLPSEGATVLRMSKALRTA